VAYKTLLFDLDDTVYPAGNGLWEAIGTRIETYMHERLGINPNEIPILRQGFHARYGTTLRGLVETYQVDELDYLAYVHDIPLDTYLKPDPAVRSVLQECTQKKIIFTNADRAHARRVLTVLGLDDLFEGVIDILDISPYCKPMPQAFQIAIEKARVNPKECVFLDDSQRNLQAANQQGLTPVLVSQTPPQNRDVFWISSLSELPKLYPLLNLT
jgi:putative hydrolase of the HAD superfamily